MKRSKGQTLLGLILASTLMGILLVGAVQVFVTLSRSMLALKNYREFHHQAWFSANMLDLIWLQGGMSDVRQVTKGGVRFQNKVQDQSWDLSLISAATLPGEGTPKREDTLLYLETRSLGEEESRGRILCDHLRGDGESRWELGEKKVRLVLKHQESLSMTLDYARRPSFLEGVKVKRVETA